MLKNGSKRLSRAVVTKESKNQLNNPRINPIAAR
jgi:hypothetical protein